MDLQRYSQEYVRIDFSIAPPVGADLEASVNLVDWVPVEMTDSVGRVLLRGPDARRSEGLLVPDDGLELYVRVADTPEDIVRSAGRIVLYK